MDRMTIRPQPGLAVPMPEGGTLPAEGLEVDRSLYWRRRLDDGDVVEVPAAKPAAAAAAGASGNPKIKEG